MEHLVVGHLRCDVDTGNQSVIAVECCTRSENQSMSGQSRPIRR